MNAFGKEGRKEAGTKVGEESYEEENKKIIINDILSVKIAQLSIGAGASAIAAPATAAMLPTPLPAALVWSPDKGAAVVRLRNVSRRALMMLKEEVGKCIVGFGEVEEADGEVDSALLIVRLFIGMRRVGFGMRFVGKVERGRDGVVALSDGWMDEYLL